MRISDWSSDVCSSDLHRRYTQAIDHARAAGLDGSGARVRPTAHAVRGDVAWCRRLCRQDPVGDLAWQSWWRVRITDGDPAVADSRFRSVAGPAARRWLPVSSIFQTRSEGSPVGDEGVSSGRTRG